MCEIKIDNTHIWSSSIHPFIDHRALIALKKIMYFQNLIMKIS